jgi:hypothetical protein
MSNTIDLGMNRTGIGMSPIDSKEMIDGTKDMVPPPGNSERVHDVRRDYAKQGASVGTVPPPATMKGMLTTALEAIKGSKPTVFIDKLAERLAFERTSTRLYEVLISKFDAYGTWKGGPSRMELVEHHDDEKRHFEIVRDVILRLGADPTAMTPCADVTMVEGLGLMQVLHDPRTNLAQSLHAILVAELADVDGWTMLASLARELGHDALANELVVCEQEEQTHLLRVRTWLTNQVLDEATRELDPRPAE